MLLIICKLPAFKTSPLSKASLQPLRCGWTLGECQCSVTRLRKMTATSTLKDCGYCVEMTRLTVSTRKFEYAAALASKN
jgi:hypothetical protein